jgi:hypothetical protein
VECLKACFLFINEPPLTCVYITIIVHRCKNSFLSVMEYTTCITDASFVVDGSRVL